MNKKGFGLIEIVVASAIISASIFALASASQLAIRVLSEKAQESQAHFLLEEGLEVARILRDFGWSSNIVNLTVGTTYYPVFGSSWSLSSSDPGKIDGVFSRSITLENVYRRSSDDDIVDISSPDPKTLDPDTKKVTVLISWSVRGGSKTASLSTYLTNLFKN